MAVEVGESFWVVADHGVEVEGLGVGEIGVGDRSGNGGPVGREKAAVGGGVVTRVIVVVSGFGIAFLAGEFVILWARVGELVLAAEGKVESDVLPRTLACGLRPRTRESAAPPENLKAVGCLRHKGDPPARCLPALEGWATRRDRQFFNSAQRDGCLFPIDPGLFQEPNLISVEPILSFCV